MNVYQKQSLILCCQCHDSCGENTSVDNQVLNCMEQKFPCGNCQICNCSDWGTDFWVEKQRRKSEVRWDCFLKAVFHPVKIHRNPLTLRQWIDDLFNFGKVALSYPATENLSTKQITTPWINSWQVKDGFQIIYMWPFIALSIKKHHSQDDQHPQQSTFREILFTAVKTCMQNLQLSVWWNVGPSNRPQKIIPLHVDLQRWINGTWKKRREASVLLTGRTAECCPLYSQGYETNQRITGICCAFSSKSWICALI